MKIDKRTLEGKELLKDIQDETSWAVTRTEHIIRRSAILILDRSVEDRLKCYECKYCYYNKGDMLAGQAFTGYECKICKKEDSYHNIAIPKLCEDCARDNKLCRTCMAEIDYPTTADRRHFS